MGVGSDGCRVEVVAESIGHALRVVTNCYPGAEICIVFPLDPDKFFVRPAATVTVERDVPVKVAV